MPTLQEMAGQMGNIPNQIGQSDFMQNPLVQKLLESLGKYQQNTADDTKPLQAQEQTFQPIQIPQIGVGGVQPVQIRQNTPAPIQAPQTVQQTDLDPQTKQFIEQLMSQNQQRGY